MDLATFKKGLFISNIFSKSVFYCRLLSESPQTGLTSLVKLLKGRPHLSQAAVDFLLGQLHLSCDSSRILICHALAAIATHLPVLGDGMLGDLVDLYRVVSHSSTGEQQELLVRDGNQITPDFLLTSVGCGFGSR